MGYVWRRSSSSAERSGLGSVRTCKAVRLSRIVLVLCGFFGWRMTLFEDDAFGDAVLCLCEGWVPGAY